jgi:hypothetical protein
MVNICRTTLLLTRNCADALVYSDGVYVLISFPNVTGMFYINEIVVVGLAIWKEQ